MERPGEIYNIIVVLLVLIVSLVLYASIRRWTDRAGLEAWSLYAWAAGSWCLAWLAWVLLYGLKLFVHWNQAEDVGFIAIALFILGDLNSVFVLFAYYGMTRGQAVKKHTATVGALIVTIGVVFYDVVLFLGGHLYTSGGAPATFLRISSGALAMAAPLLLGRGFRMRHGTISVWMAAIVYALLQPVAYGIVFPEHGHRETASVAVGSITAANPIPPGLGAFVFTAESPDSQAIVVRRVSEDSNRRRMTGTQLWDLVVWLGKQGVAGPTSLRVYLQLRLDDTVLWLLATLKLVWAATVFATFQAVPRTIAPTITIYRTVKPWKERIMMPHWKPFYFSLVSLAVLCAGLTLLVFGIDVLVISAITTLAFSVVWKAAGWLSK